MHQLKSKHKAYYQLNTSSDALEMKIYKEKDISNNNTKSNQIDSNTCSKFGSSNTKSLNLR